jgi:hypothetical protein
MKELLESLSKAKQQMKPIVKGSTNPFFKSKYFDINELLLQIEPILQENGLILVQPIEDNKVCSKIYHVKTGQYLESSMTLPGLQDPQKMGSAVTYYRRYTLQSLAALQADDDDGNAASQSVNKPVKVKLAEYTDDLANRAITKGVGLTQFKKSVNVTPKEAEAFKRMENEYNKR